MYREDTIAAVATPPGEGGVAIVRLSGPDAERIAREIFLRSGAKNGALRSHVLHRGTLRDPESGAILDDALAVLMRRPKSYTGEDVVELHCHGGRLVTRRVLEAALARGARQAEPGEFTQRAVLNGRIDLAQAEAVLDLTQARTETGMRLALEQMHGGLSQWVGALREELLDILAEIEAAIDFSEEEIDHLPKQALITKIDALKNRIAAIVATYEWGRLFREGARVCIAGRPNVGKSSLLNALLGAERVIVTPLPGTTRDVIEESVNLGGLPVALWDTAGIRETDNPIEQAGIDFTRKHLEAADAALVVIDGAESHTLEDEALMKAVRGKKGLLVVNKSDLTERIDRSWLAEAAPDKAIVSVSAKSGAGIDELKQALRELLIAAPAEPEIVLTNVRHKAALERSIGGLSAAVTSLDHRVAAELVALELSEAKRGLEEVVGTVDNEDILEHIFTKFCIGK
ncbi:MAG TPA: tRNA uridine-5-carboxymethylaminomethyl(34) synthesis GTPase MnmE [Verrucomicrobiae bacterium]|jgi:tRNA modification GTPase|nr:tRNA uridine-5-carboxymethylaminomethyl(34) synthesis GTPase MnmE [Verrucomicrobiae bacterium]